MLTSTPTLFRRQRNDPTSIGCPEDSTPFVYKYEPNEFAAYFFLAAFSLTTLLHTWQTLRTRLWFWIPFVVGGGFEVAGFVGRIIGVGEAPCYTLGPYVVMSCGTLLAPALFAASLYMLFKRIMVLVQGEHLSFVRPRYITKIFVTGDVISFLAQAAGGGLQTTKDPDTSDMGNTILIVGLWIQIAFFALFMLNGIIWLLRMRRAPTAPSYAMPWLKHLAVLFLASFLVFFRSSFRVIEYMQGADGYLISHEVFLYVLDIALMLLLMIGYHYWHPSEVLALHRGGKYMKLWATHDADQPGGDEYMLGSRGSTRKVASRVVPSSDRV